MRFPTYSKNFSPDTLVKVLSSNGSVTVSNDSAYEYAYNQFLEGARDIRIITPDGDTNPVRFRIPNPVNTNSFPLHNPKKDPPPRGKYAVNDGARPDGWSKVMGKAKI